MADVPVLSVQDRSVTLRSTMTGTPMPPFATTAGPNPKNEYALAQALLTVHVTVLQLQRPD